MSSKTLIPFVLATFFSMWIAAAPVAAQKTAKSTGRNQRDVYAEIEAAVKAGKLTKEQAQAKLAAIKKAQDDKSAKHAKGKSQPHAVYAEIEAAVKAGKLTKQQAQAKLAAIKKGAADDSHVTKSAPKTTPQADLLASKLAEMVKAKIISEKQAKAMWAAAQRAGEVQPSH